jgi:hypothetical protein
VKTTLICHGTKSWAASAARGCRVSAMMGKSRIRAASSIKLLRGTSVELITKQCDIEGFGEALALNVASFRGAECKVA